MQAPRCTGWGTGYFHNGGNGVGKYPSDTAPVRKCAGRGGTIGNGQFIARGAA